MNHDDGQAVASVAERVADGDPVDWSRTNPGSDPRLAQLQVLERVMVVHRTLRGTALSSETRSAAPTPEAWGHLRNLQRIGEGSFGEVYRAFDPKLQTWVALKLLRVTEDREPDGEERFLEEARRLARVRHQNVTVVHGVDRHEGRVGFWSELLHGKTLEETLALQGRFGAQEATSIGLDLCRALAALHAAGVIHRDVKASNVMREEGGRIVLMDLGSGGELRAQGGASDGDHLYGTPLAMAPEQLFGQVAGPATDIYGLGALLFRLVSGRHPVEASSLYELVEKHRTRERVALRDLRPDLPSDFISVVERAIEPDPAHRYRSAGSMEQALEVTLSGPRAAKVPPPTLEPQKAESVAPPLPPPPRPVRWVPALLALVVAAGVVWVGRASWLGPTRGKPSNEVAKEVAPPPPALQNPAAPASLTARATLYRTARGAEERLEPGARISPGDLLSMEIEGSSEMYVYVLDKDEEGNVFVLFPLAGLELKNPLAPNTRVRLPGPRGVSLSNWQVTSVGGKESVITIASRKPLEELEREIASFPRAEAGHPVTFGKVGPTALRALRGIGGLGSEGPGVSPGAGRLSDALHRLSSQEREDGNRWVWQMELENPAK